MDFNTVIKTRRSVREYAQKPIPDDVLRRILEAGRLAPSANNIQPWRFIVVKDAAARSQVVKLVPGQAFVATAPVLIICCGKRYPQSYNWIGDSFFLIDVAVAIEHMALAARNDGVGTCWIGGFQDQPMKKLLEIPDGHEIVMLLTVGYPLSDGQMSPISDRLPLDQIAFNERFGKPMGK